MLSLTVWMESVTSVAIVQPGVSLWGSVSISLGSWFSLSLPLAVVSQVSVVAEVVAVVAEVVAVASVGQPVSVITIAIGMSSIA